MSSGRMNDTDRKVKMMLHNRNSIYSSSKKSIISVSFIPLDHDERKDRQEHPSHFDNQSIHAFIKLHELEANRVNQYYASPYCSKELRRRYAATFGNPSKLIASVHKIVS